MNSREPCNYVRASLADSRIVSNWSIDPLDLERDVTNVIPLRPNSERLNPTQMIDRLHSLCEELQHVKSEALHLDKLLHLGPDFTKQGLIASSESLMRSLRQSPN